MTVEIIAEAGVNHNGELGLAKQLVDAASDCGADVVKFQTFKADQLATGKAPKAKYQMTSGPDNETQLEMLRQLELAEDDYISLIDYCASKNIEFLSTAFDEQSLDFLIHLGMQRIKVPSGEITNLPFLRHVASKKLEVIVSTGMSTESEVTEAIKAMLAAGLTKNLISVLHCNTSYPTPYEDVNLLAMPVLGQGLGLRFGYSDHTIGIEVPTAAVAMGATIIEKHITLDRSLPGPDQLASLEPKEFADMVSCIRNVEDALGSPEKLVTDSEKENKVVARKSLVASRDIKSGETFSAENVTAKRPGNGITPMLWDTVNGSIAKRDFLADELIEL